MKTNLKAAIQQEYALIKAQRKSGPLFLLMGGSMVWGSLATPWGALPLVVLCVLAALLLVIDAKTFILPDTLTLPGIVLGVLLSPVELPLKLWGLGIGAGAFIVLSAGFYFVKKKHGMGYGDIKLLAMLGAWLGVAALLPTLLIASITAFIAMMIRAKLADIPTSEPIPFGPFLILGGWISLLYGHFFWNALV